MHRFIRSTVAAAATAFVVTVLSGATSSAEPEPTQFAPVDRPGPALSVPQDRLAKSLQCTADATRASREVVLFVHGTTLDPNTNFAGNWFPALDKLGWPYCSVTLPENAMVDIQDSAEYLVYAFREIRRASGHEVDVVGFSQGGLVPRFALRFWPDVRDNVDDYVALAATNHGSLTVDGMCVPGCAPALQQQRYHSNLTRATNSYQETFAGISYTNIYSHTDQFVTPNLDDSGSTSLHGNEGTITNVAVQDICPLSAADHLAVGTYDPVAYALTIDALTHSGPADPKRLPSDTCLQPFMPGVDPLTFPGKYADLWNTILNELVTYPKVYSEPPLKPYVYASQ